MFVDEVKVKLIAGKGGDGCTSFRREKFVEMGGPNGGNGGKGADIIFKTDKSLRTLIDLKMMKTIKGDKGVSGKGSNKNGAGAENIIIKVPMGTTITNFETGDIIADLVKEDEEKIVAFGGRGGRGNKALATRENKAPHTSELGQPGEELIIKCELKVLADVGLVGFPSVGKSTILSMISGATPKIGAYHFTTLSPNLGLVRVYDDTFVIADLPGLIEGASDGIGLGHKFLRHAMRTKVIAHVIDMAGIDGRDPLDDYELILNELAMYDEKLILKPKVVIANKMDLETSHENLARFKNKYPDLKIFPISAILNEGLDDLIIYLNKLVKETENSPLYEISDNHKVYKYEKESKFSITKEGSVWVIKGKEPEELLLMTRFTEDESILRFARKIKGMGIEDELERLGAYPGDEVKILDYIFNYKE
ncbi:MAG: GTPase ObgE [Bacilli bacterium]|nr:GTPase ObgE [Bacilli bacterium]MDD4795345.1 GTPase ObgE [Bacilli bacterium]